MFENLFPFGNSTERKLENNLEMGPPKFCCFFKVPLALLEDAFICSKKENVWAQKMHFLPQKEASTKHYREHKDTVDGRNPAAVDR